MRKGTNSAEDTFDSRCLKLVVLSGKEGFTGGSGGKQSAHNEGDLGSIPGLGRALGGGHGNPFQYSCLENPLDRQAL